MCLYEKKTYYNKSRESNYLVTQYKIGSKCYKSKWQLQRKKKCKKIKEVRDEKVERNIWDK